MKSTGIVRKLDELGRITLPIELRRTLNISDRDPLEIFVDDERIILKKYEPCDIFTGDMNDLIDYHDKKVSKRSIIEMAKMAMKEALNCDGLNIVQNNGEIAGQTVFHFHMHIIPRYNDDGQHINWVPGTSEAAERDAIAQQIKIFLNK